MTTPINNNLHTIPQSVRTRTDAGKRPGPADLAREASVDTLDNVDHGLTTDRSPGRADGIFGAVDHQNIDWFADRDAGSRLPIEASDRFKGWSVDDIVAEILSHFHPPLK